MGRLYHIRPCTLQIEQGEPSKHVGRCEFLAALMAPNIQLDMLQQGSNKGRPAHQQCSCIRIQPTCALPDSTIPAVASCAAAYVARARCCHISAGAVAVGSVCTWVGLALVGICMDAAAAAAAQQQIACKRQT